MTMRRGKLILTGVIAVLFVACGRHKDTPQSSSTPPSNKAPASMADITSEIVAAFKKHPIQIDPPDSSARSVGIRSLFVMDLVTREVTRALDLSARKDMFLGSPTWSPDGRQISFDLVTRGKISKSRMYKIALNGSAPVSYDLGPGNMPSLSP